jgi:RNA recognition motif-containing protein
VSQSVAVKLYVGNLAVATTENALRQLFSQTGTVASVNLVKDRTSGQSKGFAFVTMTSAAGAQKAIAKLHGSSLAGRALTVNLAEQPTAPAGYQSKLGAFNATGRSPKVSTLTPGKPGDGYQSKLGAFGPGSRGPSVPRRRGGGGTQRH